MYNSTSDKPIKYTVCILKQQRHLKGSCLQSVLCCGSSKVLGEGLNLS